jgi:hypothetical protein
MLLAAFASGCSVNCTNACKKLLSCDLQDGLVLLDECEDSCQRQEVLYELWEDEEKEQALVDHERCVISSTCDEISSGVCYDSELFILE